MKQKTKRNLLIISVIIVAIVGAGFYAINWSFFDIQRINGQEYLKELTSPNGTYTVTVYLNNGGATTGYAILGTLKNNKNGKIKNIYWQYHCKKADMKWFDDGTIEINGKELNVKSEVYDYRRE